MLKKLIPSGIVAALALLLTPGFVDAYGAAHVGYTHVGPNGAYHAGATTVRGGGDVYHTESRDVYHESGGAYRAGGAAVGGYHYDSRYAGGAAAVGGVHYGYVR